MMKIMNSAPCMQSPAKAGRTGWNTNPASAAHIENDMRVTQKRFAKIPKIYNWLKWYISTGSVAIKLARETAARGVAADRAIFATAFVGAAAKALSKMGESVIRPNVAANDN
jgi:hypothetical protein